MAVEHITDLDMYDNQYITLSDDSASLTASQYLQRKAARSPISISAAVVVGATSAVIVHKKSKKRYPKGNRALALTVASAVIGGVVAHGVSSYVIYKAG